MTPQQYGRLPGTARAIVDTDRSIAAIRQKRVISIDVAKPAGELNELLRDRRVLTTRAHETWGKPLRNDGTAKA